MPSDLSEETDGGLQELNLDQPTPDLGARRQQIRQMVDARATQEFQQAHPFSPFEQPPVPTNRYRQAEATVLEQDRADAMAHRQAEVANRRAQLDQQKARNAKSEATFRGNGQQFYTDPYGEIQPVLEAGTNRPLYHPGDRTLGQDRQGLPAFIQRDKYGQNQYRRPPLRASEDPLEGQLYADLGDGQSVPYMSVDDALKHPDIQVRRQGMVADRARKNALRAASEEERKNALAPLEGAVTSADLQIKAARDRRDELEQAIAKLTDEIGGAAQTEAETTGLIMKTPTQRALVAKKINDQRRAQLSGLQNEADAIDESLKPRGALSGLKADAESKRATFKAQAIIATYDDQIAMLQDRMKSGGGNPEKDAKTLATMQAARKAIADGLEAHTPQAKPPAVQPAEEAVPEQPAPNPAVMTTGQALSAGGALPTIPTAPSPASNLPAEWAKSSPLERLKMLFGVRGYGQNEVEGAVPMIGSEAAGTKGGAFTIPKAQGTGVMAGIDNAVNKFISGMTTPENAGIMAATGGAGALADLAAATRVAVAARATEAATMGTFTGLMAKDTVTATQDAAAIMSDPKATKAEKADAIATAILSGAMTGAAGAGTADLAGRTRAEVRAAGRTPPPAPEAGTPAPTEPTPPATPTEARVNIGGAEGTIFGEDAQALAKRREAIDQLSPDEQAAKLAEMEGEGSVANRISNLAQGAENTISKINEGARTTEQIANDAGAAAKTTQRIISGLQDEGAGRVRSAAEAAAQTRTLPAKVAEEVAPEAEKNMPQWTREEMLRRGLDPARPLNDVDVANPSVREAVQADPTMTEEQKARTLDTGSPEPAPIGPSEKWYRGRVAGATEDATHDRFYSTSRDVADEFSAKDGGQEGNVTEHSRKELPDQKDLYQAVNKEGLAEDLGLENPYGHEFDAKVRDALRKRGYKGVQYAEGTDLQGVGEGEIHVFGEEPKVNIGPRDQSVSTGTGVPTAKEEAMLKEQRRLIEEHKAKSKPPETPDFSSASGEDVDAWETALREHDRNSDVQVFGEEGAKEYRRLQRTANSTNWPAGDPRFKAVDAKIAEMEAALTPQQQDILYGRNLPKDYVDLDTAKGLRNAAIGIDSSDTGAELARASSRIIQSAMMDASRGKTIEGRQAQMLQRVMKRAKELKVAPKELVKLAFKYRAGIEGADVFELAGTTPEQFAKFIGEEAAPKEQRRLVEEHLSAPERATGAARAEDARRRGKEKADAGIVPYEEWAEFRKARADMATEAAQKPATPTEIAEQKAKTWADTYFKNRGHTPTANQYRQVYDQALGRFLKETTTEEPPHAPSPRQQPENNQGQLPRAEERPAIPENQKEVRAAKGAEPDDGNRAQRSKETEKVVREERLTPANLASRKLKPNHIYVWGNDWGRSYAEGREAMEAFPYKGDPVAALKAADMGQMAAHVIVATDAAGKPSKVISPSGKSVADFGTPEAQYMAGDVYAPDRALRQEIESDVTAGRFGEAEEKQAKRIKKVDADITNYEGYIAKEKAQDKTDRAALKSGKTVTDLDFRYENTPERQADYFEQRRRRVESFNSEIKRLREQRKQWESLVPKRAEVADSTPPAQMKPAGGKGDTLIARSKPKPRADVDNGTRYSEWRIRKVTPEDYNNLSEGQRSRGDANVGDFKVERRIIKTQEGGPTETGEWETSSYGKTKKEAVEDAHYEQGYMDAESLDPAHEKAVQDSRARVEELRRIEANKSADLKAEDELREKYIQEVRATPLKGTSREIDIAFNDADGNPSTRKESAMVYGNWAITKKGEGKRAEYVVTHVPTGLKVQSKPTVGQAKEVIQAFIHSGLDVASKDLVSDRDTVAKLAQAARALNGGTAPEWFKAGGESSPSQSVAVTPESRQEKLRQQALRETERVRKAAAAEAPKAKPMNMAGEVRPEKAQPVPAPEFTNLHPKAQDRFNAAWEAKDAKAMSEYLDPQNPGFRAEWEKRTGAKLPKGIGATDKAVADFFGAEGAPTQSLSDRAIAALQKAKIGKPGRILSADPFTVAYDAAIDFAILAIRAGRAVGDVVKLATQRFMAKHPKATPEEVARVTQAINSAVAAPAKPITPESKPSLLPESLKAAGAPAETINYEVRTQDARKQEASDIIKRDGAAKAEEMITSSELPGDTKVAIGGQLINDKMLSLAKATPEEAVKLANDIQRITAKMQPKLATEAGQTISMFSGIYDDVRTASAMEYIRDAQGKRLEKMGGEEGGKAADEAAKIFNKTKDPAAREKEIEKLKERYTTKPVRRMLDQLKRMEVAQKLNSLGVLTRDDMVEVAGNALGIPGISQKRLKHIAELADRVHTAKNHAERSRAELELSDTLNIYKGVSPLDLEASILTLNILSGPTTQAANILGNTLQGISQIGHAALANPTKVRALVDGILDGIPDGMTQAKSILATGRGSRDFADKTGGSSNVLNTIDYAEDYPSLPKKAADALTTRARMVEKISRFMKAADAVFYYPAREAYARLVTTKLLEGQYKGDELDAKVDQLLHTTTASFESARKQAEGEGYTGIDLGRRVSDIIEERRAQTPIGAEAVKQSERFAAESTYNQEPVGLAGVIYRNLARTTSEANIGGVPILKPWTMFLKVPANVFNETTNFTPIGGVRATFGMQGEKYRKGGSGEGQWRNFNRDERNRLYLKSIVGTTLMAGLVARSIQNPDDTPIVSANGPQDTAKRRQLMNAGWKPYSIRVGDKWISYRDSPLLVPLAVAGHVSDSLRYNKPEPDVTTEQRVADAVLASPQTIFQTSMLSGMADLMASLSGKGGGLQAVGRTLGSIPANLVIPYNRLLQQIDQTFDPKTYDTNAVVGGVPFVRRLGNEIADVQGRPQTYSPSDRFASAESKDPVDRLLLDKNLAIPEVGRDVKIGNRNMTEDEHDLYRKISGQRIRVRLQTIEPRLRGMTREKAQDEIERISREERARVKPRIAAQVPMATAAK